MRPKGKLFALVAVFAAIAVVTASGAFTTVTAQRTADVQTAGDGSALLGLSAHTSNNGQLYAQTPNGELEISLDTGDADGVNQNATTEIDYVFNITNNGDNTVYVWIEKSGTYNQYVNFYNGTAGSVNMTTSVNDQTVGSGDTVEVSMTIDTVGADIGENAVLLETITIHANTTQP